jgi:hypothetical protein
MQHHGSAPLVIEHPLRNDSALLLVLAEKLTPDAHTMLGASLPSNYDFLTEQRVPFVVHRCGREILGSMSPSSIASTNCV